MKQFGWITVCILVVALVFAAMPTTAFAQDELAKFYYTPSHGGYTLATLVDSTTTGNPIALRFNGYYFGNSDIVVTFEVYSSPGFVIDFFVNDTLDNYTSDQLLRLKALKDMCEDLHQLITAVDNAANTQYDGSPLSNGNQLPTSDIYLYNQAANGTKLEISQHTYNMLQIAQAMYKDTDGAFNPAVYRLVDLWGFSSRIYSNGNFGLPYDREVSATQFATNGYPLPDEKYIQAFSDPQFTNFYSPADPANPYPGTGVNLLQEGEKYFVQKLVVPVVVDGVAYQQWLDLGGIAKGYVVDCIKQAVTQIGFSRYYVDAGSSSTAFGDDPFGNSFKMQLTDPFDKYAQILPRALMEFAVGRSSVSTSGQYVRKYTTDGVEYSHIVDGTLGKPAQTGIKLVSVIVPEDQGLWAGKSDCLTTALTVMGREKIVEFINGYLKQHNIKVVVLYQNDNGTNELLTNYEQAQITAKADSFNDLAWSLVKGEDGQLVYQPPKPANTNSSNTFKVWTIVLGSVAGVAVVALVVYHFVRGRKTALQKVQFARKDKPFKPADVVVYMLVVLVIAVLFASFFGNGKEGWKTLQVVDMQTGEQLFLYNVSTNKYQVNTDNTNGWQIEVTQNGNKLSVTLSKEVDGKTRFNTLEITGGASPVAVMADSLCGFHQDCVRNFGNLTMSGGAIVCSPNRLKVVTE